MGFSRPRRLSPAPGKPDLRLPCLVAMIRAAPLWWLSRRRAWRVSRAARMAPALSTIGAG